MMEFFSGGSATMEGAPDEGKARFQKELSKWFESRGVVADLRSHLRHLMITALQSAQVGTKPTDGSSPKAQALNLLVAEYLFRHRCHYTLSVFTSEVPTLASFNLDAGLQGGKKRPRKNYFQEDEVEEILDALGMSSCAEELTVLKRRYLDVAGDVSLVELFLRLTLELATKLQVRQNLESHAVDGERVLSKEWSSKVVDVLLMEKVTPSQVSAVEEAIFRITENEIKRAADEQRKAQMEMLSVREKRIQEYLRKHEEEIFVRLMEAEEELRTRKDMIEEELSEREKHLTKMAVEWGNKHEEILRLSRKFYNIENENKSYKKKLKEVEEENRSLRALGESQRTTIDDLREELNSLISKLKEVTESNAILSERIQVLIARETKDVLQGQDDARQTFARAMEIPLLWPKNTDPDSHSLEASRPMIKPAAKKQPVPRQDLKPAKAIPEHPDISSESSEDEGDSLSSSFADIIQGVQQKLQFLEEESNRLNKNYLEYKLKYISADSDSDSSSHPTVKSPSPVPDGGCTTETKFCQTYIDDTFVKLQKLKETKEEKYEFDCVAHCDASEKLSPKMPIARAPTKRQLQNRDFFLKSRHLVQQFEKRQAEELQASLSFTGSSPSSSGEELTSSKETSRKSPLKSVVPTPLKTLSEHSDETSQPKDEPPPTDCRKALVESPNQTVKSDADCLALLEETRIKSPQLSARMPLRQQMLLSESEKEEAEEEKIMPKSVVVSPLSNSSGRISFGRKTGNDGFW